jgi:hypothetical protein
MKEARAHVARAANNHPVAAARPEQAGQPT